MLRTEKSHQPRLGRLILYHINRADVMMDFIGYPEHMLEKRGR